MKGNRFYCILDVSSVLLVDFQVLDKTGAMRSSPQPGGWCQTMDINDIISLGNANHICCLSVFLSVSLLAGSIRKKKKKREKKKRKSYISSSVSTRAFFFPHGH
jgi:hypothetical protein